MATHRDEFAARRAPPVGERLFVPCDAGPCTSRLVQYPPPPEIEERSGMYVLNDDGSQDDWIYVWVPREF